MYIPKSFKVNDDAQIEAFLQRYDFATLVSSPSLLASHVPVMVRREASGLVLAGHVARANPHWELMDGTAEALAIFLGPHAYISPTWYATSPAVPTWNYGVVHAYGRPRAIHDAAGTKRFLSELVLRYETGPQAWRMESLPPELYERLLSAIVAFEMPVERLEAQFKLGQNRSAADRAGAIAGLERQPSAEAAIFAEFMRTHAGTSNSETHAKAPSRKD